MRILHVSESLNGGVLEIVKRILDSTPYFENFLLWDSHQDSPGPNFKEFSIIEDNIFSWGKNKIRKGIVLYSITKRLKPDVIHVHSSKAGFYCRLLLKNQKIIYSPHGFSFQKKDVSKFIRILYFVIELSLQNRTNLNLAFWPIEVKHAELLTPKRKPELTGLVLDKFSKEIELSLKTKFRNIEYEKPIFLVIGRITAAKDPEYVMQLSKELELMNSPIKIQWIGSGSLQETNRLIQNGIQVLGWSSQAEIEFKMQSSVGTLITSSWDAGPLTLFESISKQNVVIARNTPNIRILGLESFNEPVEFARIMNEMVVQKNGQEKWREQCHKILEKLKSLPFVNVEDVYREFLFRD